MMDLSVKDQPEEVVDNDRSKLLEEISDEIFHDFKNILANISGLAQLSMLKAESEEIKHNLSEIYQATYDIRDILTRYHDYSTGCYEEVEQAENVNMILGKALKLVNYKFDVADEKGNIISLKSNIKSNASVICNEAKMMQSFLNIIMNAIEAMEDEGGTLTIDLYEENNSVILEVGDNGSGMNSEILNRLFIRRFTTKENGSGLGLRIAKVNVENIKGTIDITSTEGVGTKVKISLPIYR